MISLIRAVDPQMLQRGPDGFSVDFEKIDKKDTPLSADELLLLKLRAGLEGAGDMGHFSMSLDAAEGQRLAGTLERLEAMQMWPADVLALSHSIRARLTQQAE